MINKKIQYKKIALVLSLCLIIVWAVLGTGTSLAWFIDTSTEIKNVFNVAEFELEVSHRLEDGTYEKIDADTKVFDDEALYEPGYVQIVFLKVDNKGTVPFDFNTAVSITDYTVATNVFGQKFNLQKYLKFGLIVANTEDELMLALRDRNAAKENANMPLNNYSSRTAPLGVGESAYIAIIVRMPEEIGNEANYRGDIIPKVELGLTVSATQQKN